MEQGYTYLVHTFCATYNHENYILDALKGFVMQETSFPVVYAIVDDASTDQTTKVIRDFLNENFDLQDSGVAYEKEMDYGHITFARNMTNRNCYFVVLFLKENHYHKKSKLPYLVEWRNTKYYAICEGDDYWTDPLKLQKQVDFLESNAEFDLCCASSKVFVQKNNCFCGLRGSAMCEKYNTIIQGYNDINTATVLARTDAWEKCTKELGAQLSSGLLFDTAYWYWFAFHEKTKYMAEPMAVYRILENSASHSYDKEKSLKRDLRFLRLKLEFLLLYPVSEEQKEIVDELMKEIESLCRFSQFLGEQKVRKSRSYKLGSSIKSLIKWRNVQK